jgi:hypothetical protein
MWSAKDARCVAVKYWEIIADSVHNAGWSLGWVSALDLYGRTSWIVHAHRGDGKRFIVCADSPVPEAACYSVAREVMRDRL